MKILLSPSKTKVITGKATTKIFSEKLTNILLTKLQQMSASEIGKLLKIKDDKAQEVKQFYDNFAKEPAGQAALSYSGLAFKNLAWLDLDRKAQEFGQAHLVILSAFYGIVTPESPLKDYRLDLVDSLLKEEKTNLYEFWSSEVNAFLAQEDWLLNMASKEYSKLVTHPRMVTVEFQELRDGEWKQLSTSSKQMRGRLVHYILVKAITDIRDLPKELGNFKLTSKLPREVSEPIVIVYQKQ